MSRYHYKKKKAISVVEGIRAENKRGSFGQKWCGQRWLEILEQMHEEARLARGRSYARKGQVLSITIEPSLVLAKVQGSRKKPYIVEIRLPSLPLEEWQRIIAKMGKKALFCSQLFSGKISEEVEEIFHDASSSLFPTKHSEWDADCSCPDWSNPCKHIAAVYYLLSEEFDRDPFLLFQLRGIKRKIFLALLEEEQLQGAQLKEGMYNENEPLSSDPFLFWEGKKLPEDFFVGERSAPKTPGLFLQSLGKFPLWKGEESLTDFLEDVYQATSQLIDPK